MFFKKLFSTKSHTKSKNEDLIPETREKMSTEFKQRLQNSADILENEIGVSGITLFSIGTLIDKTMLHRDIINPLKELSFDSIQKIMEHLSIGEIEKSNQMEKAVQAALDGNVIIFLDGNSSVLLAKIPSRVGRSVSYAQNESQVIGPQMAFTESLLTNITLIRSYIKDTSLCIENLQVGARTNKLVSIVYINGMVSEQMVDSLRKRIQDIKMDGILDSSVLEQLLAENSLTIFPQMALTERPDRVSDWLLKGKVAVLVDGSSLAIVCPQSFMEFFKVWRIVM